MNRHSFALVVLMMTRLVFAGDPVARVQVDRDKGTLIFLSWDTEGGPRTERNLLREPARFSGQATADGGVIQLLDANEITLCFDPRVTSTTVLPSKWDDDGTLHLPAIVNAPDFGPMLLTAGEQPVTGTLEGSREEKWVKLKLRGDGPMRLRLSPLLIPPPTDLKDSSHWGAARRGWLNAIQPCARWGEQDRAFSSPAGMLGNNVISDPASCSLWFYADQVFFIPEPAPGVSVMPLVRRTIDYWIDQKMRRNEKGNETGEITGYWDYGHLLDANAGPLIAAWDYVEVSGDTKWLELKIPRLEMVADFLISRDIDDDGLIEATQSGDCNMLQQPNRSCAWWDALNCGHKDGYTNALAYRALRCMADLESKLGRGERSRNYSDRADRLKAAYFSTLYNPKSGWLAWWKSRDGTLHDYASPTLNGLAIDYGLVPPEHAKAILDRLWQKMDAVKFTRFDLGVPPMLVPVRRGDYLQPNAIGMPTREDGTDTFGVYMNGGITAGHVLHFLSANYVVGDNIRADQLLAAMLQRQQRGEFQNGVTDSAMGGIDWTTWDGKPAGYEGYLSDSFRFLQAVLMREPQMREKLLRPLNSDPSRRGI